MRSTTLDAALVATTITLAALLGGLWFSLLSPLLALLVTTTTSLALSVANVWWFYRQQDTDEVGTLEEVDDDDA